MSAEILQRAASLMRERAEAARNNNPWMVDSDRPNVVLDPDKPGNDWDGLMVCEVPLADDGLVDFPTVEHIASWHPAVALAVADWLESVAGACSPPVPESALDVVDAGRMITDADAKHALAVARAYLGES